MSKETTKTAVAAPDPLREVVNAWFNDQFHNHGPFLSEPVFAHCLAAKEKLLERLVAFLAKEG